MSSAKKRVLPNWALKTAMAASGSLLALMLVIKLIVNLWFFTGSDHFNVVTTRVSNLFYPYLPQEGWLWIVRVVAVVLLVAHVSIGVVLVLRARAGRGIFRTRLQGGQHAWLTRLMPHTGAATMLFALFYVLDQVFHALVAPWVDIDPGFSPNLDPAIAQSYMQLYNSLSHPWIAVVYIIGLLAMGAHVFHGLGTVATIAAGSGVFAGRIKRWLVLIGGALFLVLMLANILIPIGVQGGWLR